jgi:hypothetical protein
VNIAVHGLLADTERSRDGAFAVAFLAEVGDEGSWIAESPATLGFTGLRA